MKCLAIDTTTDISSIAVADESGVLAEYNFAHKMDLSKRLMVDIEALLKDCGLEMKDIESVGVSLGPGSFTGLKIGVVTAKTLAQVLNVPIAGIVTLDLLAHQFDYLPDAIICPLIKVRKGEAYYAFFCANKGNIERISEYTAGPITEVIEQSSVVRGPSSVKAKTNRQDTEYAKKSDIKDPLGDLAVQNSGIIFCGDALKDNLLALQDALGDKVIPAPAWLSYPKASILARLALEKITRGEADDLLSLVPFYIRRSAPEERASVSS